jgi:hypothetical protein
MKAGRNLPCLSSANIKSMGDRNLPYLASPMLLFKNYILGQKPMTYINGLKIRSRLDVSFILEKLYPSIRHEQLYPPLI